MPKLEELDSKLWKSLKKNAGIAKSGWFKKADASVGKHIKAVNKARDDFENRGYLTADLLKYQEALKELDEVFDKFVTSKGLDEIDDDEVKADEKKELKAEIEKWREQIDFTIKALDSGVRTLFKAVNNDTEKLDMAEKSKRKAIMEKTLDNAFPF